MSPADVRNQGPTLAEEVSGRRWYHTLELPGGIVTPGEYDLRSALRRVPLPASLEGKRCLDVGTHDGFWAFEMERRGASEVVAIDLEDPDRYDWQEPRPELTAEDRDGLARRREAFSIARRALNSTVARRDVSVYELEPAEMGEFDFAVIGTLLLHLRDPAGALMGIARVLRGELLVNEPLSLALSALMPRTPAARLAEVKNAPFWWIPNLAGLRSLVRRAGLEVRQSGGPYFVANGPGYEQLPFSQRRGYGVNAAYVLISRLGMPHGWVLGAASR